MSIEKHIDFFTKGYCSVDSIEEFMEGDIAEYISRVYGPMRYTVDYRPNFIKVFQLDGKYIISDNLFYDRFPIAEYCGNIVPANLDYHTAIDHRGGNSAAGARLAHHGFVTSHLDLSKHLYDSVTGAYYINADFELECDVFNMQTENAYPANVPATVEQQSFKITAEYYNAIMTGDKWYALPYLEEHRHLSKANIENAFKDNYTISNSTNHRTYLQKMTKGDSMSRHIDSNVSGVNNYLVNGITWVCEGEFKGRDLVLGHRSPQDLMNLIKESLTTTTMDAYGATPVDYTDTDTIHPFTGGTVYVNSFNPYFYHGVTPLEGTGSVYTIINDFQPR